MTTRIKSNNHLTFIPVERSNWYLLEKFFESRGGPHYCWCMVWRRMKEGTERSKKADKKESLKHYVSTETPIGLLCLSDSEPIGWCSIAPRESYKQLHGDPTLQDVWSLVCFFIKREFRKKNLTRKFIREAEKYARNNGAKHIEAYPVDADSPSYRFMGVRPLFENLGYNFKQKAGKRRNVMVKTL